MGSQIYEIVQHDGGWAYRAEGTVSETFRTRGEAEQAASRAAGEQRQPGEPSDIEYEDSKGDWHRERATGSDRPITQVNKAERD